MFTLFLSKGHHMATGICVCQLALLLLLFLQSISSFTCTLASEHVPSSSHFWKHTAAFSPNAWQAGTFCSVTNPF